MRRIVVAVLLACAAGIVPGCKKEKVLVGSLALSATRVVLSEGDSVVLTASVDPAWATDKVVEWRTSDAQVALVSAEGRVVAVGVGEAIVSAIARDESGVKAECAVKVLPRNDRHREGGFSAGR